MRRLTILGGPRDGEAVDYVGPELRLPVSRPITVFADPGRLPTYDDIKVDRYVAQQDYDGRWWYVWESAA